MAHHVAVTDAALPDPLGFDPPTRWPRTAAQDAAAIRRAFDAHARMRVGVEEELMLVRRADLAPDPIAPDVVHALGGDGVACELIASQLETITPVCDGAGEAAGHLLATRSAIRRVLPPGTGLAGAGTHPLATGRADVTPASRYERIAREYGYVATHLVPFGQHVHVSVPGAERALAVFNALRSYLPELLALSASSPFLGGDDTGLASVRATFNAAYPRAGVPPALRSWDEFVALLSWGRRTEAFPDATYLWWDARLSGTLGTIEVRVLDSQATVEDAAALVAVVHALVHRLAARHESGEALPVHASEAITENRWRALRHGLRGTLIDLDSGGVRPTRGRLRALLEELAPDAELLGCQPQLAHAHALLAGNGADRQRRIAARGDVRDVVRWLVEQADMEHPSEEDR